MILPITGQVNHSHTGRGLEGILVSNGEHVVKTNEAGRFNLKVDPVLHHFIFVCMASGYKASTWFHRCNDLVEGTRVDFVLMPDGRSDARQFKLAHVTDLHICLDQRRERPNPEQVSIELRRTIEDGNADLVIAGGDLTDRGTEAELLATADVLKQATVPVFPLFAGHDGSVLVKAKAPDPSIHYERILGPCSYSLDWGGRHFVLFANEFGKNFAEARRPLQLRWLEADLLAQPEGREIIVVTHIEPNSEMLSLLSRYNITHVFFGHWHSNKVYHHGKMIVAATPPLCFGGIDTSPKGWRQVQFSNDSATMNLRSLGPEIQSPPSPLQPKSLILNSAKPSPSTWCRNLPGYAHRAAPVVCINQLLLARGDKHGMGEQGVYALDIETGQTNWVVKTDASVKNQVTPVGDSVAAISVTGRLYRIDVNSGQVAWTADLSGYPQRWIYSSPLAVNDTIVVGASGGYAAYDWANGKCCWTTPSFVSYATDWLPCYANPLLAGGNILVLVPRRGLVALDPKTGSIVWQNDMNLAYFCATPICHRDQLLVAGPTGDLSAIALTDGSLVWQKTILEGGWITGMQPIDENWCCLATTAGEIRCVNLDTGTSRWEFSLQPDLLDMIPYRWNTSSSLSAPVRMGETIIVSASDGCLYALDFDGNCVSANSFGSPITASSTTDGSRLLFTTFDSRVFRFG